MRIFVTGASGFVGAAIVRELLQAGHQVVGLARSDAAAKVVADSGAIVYRGDLEKPESLERGASEADGIIPAGWPIEVGATTGRSLRPGRGQGLRPHPRSVHATR